MRYCLLVGINQAREYRPMIEIGSHNRLHGTLAFIHVVDAIS